MPRSWSQFRSIALLGLISLSLGERAAAAALIPVVEAPVGVSQLGRLERRRGAPIIPAKTAVVGKVLLDIVLDPGRKYDMPVTLISAIPIYDDNGVVVIPTEIGRAHV